MWGVQALLFLGVYLGVTAWQGQGLATGPAPDFQVTTLGGAQSSPEGLRGRTWLLHFWASWCPVCQLEEDALAAVAGDWPVLGMAYLSGAEAELRAYVGERGIGFPVAMDQEGLIGRQYGVTAVPVSFIIDSKGRIRFTAIGYTSSVGLRMRLWWADHVGG